MARRTSFIDLYDRLVLARPGVTIAVLLAVFALFFVWAKDFRLDASEDSLVLEHDQDLLYSRRVGNRYHAKEFVVVTYSPPEELFSGESLDRLKRLRGDLISLARIESVYTILDVPLLKNPPVPLEKIRKNIKTLESKGINKRLAVAEFKNSPVYRNLLVSEDLRSAAIQVNFRPDKTLEPVYVRRTELLEKETQGALAGAEIQELERVSLEYRRLKDVERAARQQDIASIRAVLDKYRSECRLFLGGVPMVSVDIIDFIRNDLKVFGLGMLCFLVLSLGVIFRSKRWVLLPMLSCVFSVLVMVGLLGLVGWEVTVVSSNFISLLLVFAMEISIYLIVRYRELRALKPDEEHRQLVRETVRSMFVPCIYCVLTTVAGFASLVVCDILPVMNFGFMMCMGLVVNMTIVFLFFPAALMLLKKPPLVVEKEFGRSLTSAFARLAENRVAAILIASLLIASATVAGISKLEVENSFINYFKKTTEIYKGMNFIDRELGGTTPLDVLIDFGSESPEGAPQPGPAADADFEGFEEFEEEKDPAKYWFTASKLELVEKVHDYLDELPETGKVLSLATLWKITRDINRGTPPDSLTSAILFNQMPEEFKDFLVRPYASIENNQARIMIRIKDSMPSIKRDAFLKRIKSDLQSKLGLREDQFRLTGLMILYNNMLQSLYSSQVETIGWTFLTLSLMFLALFRSFKIAVIAMFPNALSCLSVLGVMGAAGIPLDVMTITVVSIGMGVAVDSTIQYLYRFRTEIELDPDYAKAMHRCHDSIGNAMYYTCGTMVAGYSILAMSNFIPSILFGLLSALAMVMSLLGALCLLPTLIILTKPFGPERAPMAR